MTAQDYEIERAVIKSFGIDAPDAEDCPRCELRHWPYRDCPPVLPLDTASGGYLL